MLPEQIDNTNFRYIELDNKYISSIVIKSFPEKIYFLDIIKDIKNDIDYDMSIYIKKLDAMKVLNDITYNIASSEGELYTINSNQRNIDVIKRANDDSKKLRRQIQVENQEIYDINIILTFYSYDLNQLLKILSSIKAKFYSKQIGTDITNFRHLEFYLSNLPLSLNKSVITEKLCITTNALANIFPFYTNSIIDRNGIFIGYTKQDNRICMLNIFSNKYENSNMCIFGTSGSGKSFFIKLFILRNFFQGKTQIILDIENEYIDLCKNLSGQLVFEDTYFNILQITHLDIKEDKFLERKIDRIANFIYSVCDTNTIEINILKKEIKKLYYKFNITEDINSILKGNTESILYLEPKILEAEKFPTLEDLKNNVENEQIRRFLEIEMKSNLKFFSRITNIDLNSKLFVLVIKNLNNQFGLLSKILDFILNRFLGNNETIIYIDEMWKYAKEKELLECLFNMYKTIRKRRGAIIGITQDITDFFAYNNGNYANSILNNSCFKMIFKTEDRQHNLIDSILEIDKDNLACLNRGQAYLTIGKNNILLKLESSIYERETINENDNRAK